MAHSTEAQQAPKHEPRLQFRQHDSGASVDPRRERTASVSLVTQRDSRPHLKHTAKPMRIPPVHLCMLTIVVCTRADRAERASMVWAPTVVLGIQETDIDRENDVKNPDDCDARLTIRAMETRFVGETDASYRCEKARGWTSALVKVVTDRSLSSPY